MKKRLFSLLAAAAVAVSSFALGVSAAGELPDERLLPRVVDDADLLTDSEETALLEKVDEISERQKMDVVIVTVDSLEGKSSTAYADDFFDYNGYGYGIDHDGILLLISMANRDWAISTCGEGIRTFTDAGQAYMVDQFKPYLSDGDYDEAFNCFADLCDDFITQAKNGAPYDSGNMPKGEFRFGYHLVISIVIGVIVALIAVTIMKGQLKSVKQQYAASYYTKKNSMHITESKDLFLYNKVSKRAIPKSSGGGGSSSHHSSSGRSHGGSSGHF
ncbi:MAG: TPM domain-containing protein [Oscillospiraceae bacterium]